MFLNYSKHYYTFFFLLCHRKWHPSSLAYGTQMPRRVGRHVLHKAHQDMANGGTKGRTEAAATVLSSSSSSSSGELSVYYAIIPESCVLHASLRLNAKMRHPATIAIPIFPHFWRPKTPLIAVFPGTPTPYPESPLPYTHLTTHNE